MNSQGPLGVQGIEEKRNPPSEGELRGHLEGLFFTTVSLVHKYTLRAASELTPPRVGYAFLQYLALQEGPGKSTVWATLAHNSQKVLKKVFDHFQIYPGQSPRLSPKSEEKWGNPPAGPSAWGDFPTFSGIWRLHGPGARDLPRIVFLEEGLFYPHRGP